MKKALLIIGLFISTYSFAQYPILQNQGSDSTMIKSKGAYWGGKGIVNAYYEDTIAANLSRISYYANAQIITDSGTLWIRNPEGTGWRTFIPPTGFASITKVGRCLLVRSMAETLAPTDSLLYVCADSVSLNVTGDSLITFYPWPNQRRIAAKITGAGGGGSSGLDSVYVSSDSIYQIFTYASGRIDSFAILGGSSGITSLNGLTGATQTFATGTSGTDFGISSASTTHTFNLPTASASNRGALSTTDWSTFNNKQATISVTTPITLTGASVGMVNQGTTTTVLHGNAAGNPSFGAIVNADITNSTIDLTTKVTGILPVANGGTGTATPGLVAGTNITSITGTWPNQTINASGGGSSYTFSTGLTNTASTITNNLSTGVSGGQTMYGGTASGDSLRIYSTSHATKGKILFGSTSAGVGASYNQVNDRLTIPTVTQSGTIGQGIFFGDNAGQNYATVGALNTGSATIAYLGANKYYNGSAWVDMGASRVGSSFQITDNIFTYYSFNTGITTTPRFGINSSGQMFINSNGTASSQLDIRDATATTFRVGHPAGDQYTYTQGRSTSGQGYYVFQPDGSNTTPGYQFLGGSFGIGGTIGTAISDNTLFETISTTKGTIPAPKVSATQINLIGTGVLNGGYTIAAGSSYTNGTFGGTALTGGSGTGAVASITVVGGAVSAMTISTVGSGYAIGDVLSASLAGGSGFTATVTSLSGPSGLQAYDTTTNSVKKLNNAYGWAEQATWGYTATAVDYTARKSDYTIEVTATGKTITLPTAVGIKGRCYTIKLTASGSGTVGTTSSQNIDGSSTYSLASQYKYVTVQSNNTGWLVIANN